ncbi:MAG TPA: multifunctional CCA addition/repair protein [Alcanivoracaceae bacterium]|nr:multifunctional CCA addition/repair protein [Alcanivoracaceae bacterium]
MKDLSVFLVGGAVRDQLLGLPVHENDWVVVGSTEAQMKTLGFQQVGKDFPVFLHPKSKEEYALARTERKTGHGYHGFTLHAHPSVTLEEDLLRRDLTINAMAQANDGHIIDPYGGREDLKARLLRHVSPAFAEDPLRVLRVARFAARFHHLGFTVAPETLALMRTLSTEEELLSIAPERLWQETHTALAENNPQVYFQTLEACGALTILFPELASLRGVPQPKLYHPEVDTLEHQYLALKIAADAHYDVPTRFAVLVHDLGKGLTPEHAWPQHIAHERKGLPLVRALCKRLRVPKQYQQLGLLMCEWHTHAHRALELRPGTIWKLFHATDAIRRPERFKQFLQACVADARGRTGKENERYPQKAYLLDALEAAHHIDMPTLQEQFSGAALGEAIQQARIIAIKEFKQQWATLS